MAQAEVHAVHVQRNGPALRAAQMIAHEAGLKLQLLHGEVAPRLAALAEDPLVLAVAVGAHRRPYGSTVGSLLRATTTPVAVVPPATVPRRELDCIVAPVDDCASTTRRLWNGSQLARAAGIEFVTVPEHDRAAWFEQHEADMIALAWSRGPGRGHTRFIRNVLQHANVPVLLLPITESGQPGASELLPGAGGALD